MKNISLLEQKPLVDSYLAQGPRPLSAFSFVSLFAWGDFFDFEFKVIDGCLCIFAHGRQGSFLYLPPLGRGFGSSTLEAVFRHMAHAAGPAAANRIENIPGNLLSAFHGHEYNQYSKSAEYVYRKDDLIALKGNAYKSQRHDCNCFEARHAGISFLPYTDGDLGACVELYERWARHRDRACSDDVYRSMIQENRLVHARLLENWRALGLVVKVLKTADGMAGYSIGYAVDDDTFCIYAEISDLAMTGAAAFMFRGFCADEALASFSRINVMDDFAMPNVAAAKQAYRPSEMVDSYTVSLKI
jgi:hypothetical protein